MVEDAENQKQALVTRVLQLQSGLKSQHQHIYTWSRILIENSYSDVSKGVIWEDALTNPENSASHEFAGLVQVAYNLPLARG